MLTSSRPIGLGFALATVLALLGCDKARLVAIDAGPPPGVGAQVPGPPPVETEGPDQPVHVWVLRDVVLRQGSSGIWQGLGWNLDGRCSYPPSADSDASVPLDGSVPDGGPYAGWDIECAPADPDDAPAPDGIDCRDNAYGQYIALGLETLEFDPEAEARDAMNEGRFALLVRMHGYNGTPNDPLVVMEIAQTAWGVPEGGERGDPLRWDGTDTFLPATQAYDERGQPILLDRAGYVVDGRFVMRLPPASDFRFAGTNVSIAVSVRDATLSGTIHPTSGLLEGVVLSARWPVDALLNELDDLGVCAGSALRAPVERAIRGSADVLANPEARPGALIACDAVSAAIGFTGYPGRFGKPARMSPTRPSACAQPPMPDAGPLPDGGPSDAGLDGGV